jgi:hypothetical protein
LTRNVEIALGIKRNVKGVIDSGILVRVTLYEHSEKIVLPIFIERALKLQDFAIFEVGVDHIEILVWPEYKSPKLTKRNPRRKTVFV